MHVQKILARVAGLLLTAFFASTAAALPTGFSKIYGFGDSLIDIGNVSALSGGTVPSSSAPNQRYHDGRFTNGPNWVDHVAAAMGINAGRFIPSMQAAPADFGANYSINFAYGGSGTGISNRTPDNLFEVRGLQGQVGDFSTLATAGGGVTDADHSLYVVWTGPNDYLLAGIPTTGIPNPPDPTAVVQNIKTSIQNLYDLGARNFLVPNLPYLGQIPITALSGPGAQAYLDALTDAHNALLYAALLDLRSANPGITLYSPDINALFREILIDPSALGFTHSLLELGPASGCLILPPNTCESLNRPGLGPLDGDGFPIWDEEHPSAATQALIAQRALAANAVPAPPTSALVLIGILALSGFRIPRAVRQN